MKHILGWTSRKSFFSLGLLLIVSIWGVATWSRSQLAGHPTAQLSHIAAPPDAATKARLSEAYGQLPLSFEGNAGQIDPQVDFISRGSGYTLFLKPGEAVLALRAASGSPTKSDSRNVHDSAMLRMKFVGSEAKPRVAGKEELPGKVNYMIGNDPKQWRTGISTYAKVAYENLYPGVDLVYYGNQRQLEYDFVVQPGTDPNIIALNFEGANGLEVDAQGELVLRASGGEIRQRKPLIYQEVDGVRHEVAGHYRLKDDNTVGFQIADYDASRPLVIDPVLVYSTFLGGANVDDGFDITVDGAGNAYVTGSTQLLVIPSTFPTTAGAFDTTHNGGSQDAFVTKLNPTGSALVYSTFLGGSNLDSASGITVDSASNAYVTGTTESPDFPTTPGAFDTMHNGGRDAFVTKLNASGSALVYSTFLGGLDGDFGRSLVVDTSGNAYVTGDTFSSSFPTTPGAFDTTISPDEVADVFVTKLNPAGSALVYSTFLGDTGANSGGIALDTSGSVYVTGTSSAGFPTTAGAFDTTSNGFGDVFVTKFNSTGSALVYSTFIGGSTADEAHGIAVDNLGSAYVTGFTTSSNFPTTAGAFDTIYNGGFADVFVTKVDPTGAALAYSTFLGGGDFDNGNDIVVDASGSVYLTGSTASDNFPTTADAFDTTHNVDATDGFVTRLNPSGSALVYSTFLGGPDPNPNSGVAANSGLGIALDSSGSIYVTGATRSPDFPTTAGALDTTFNGVEDAFIAKFSTITGGVPATLTLNPPAATNAVDSEHCVTATVHDASGSPVANVEVRFQVTGSVDTSGSATTDANGEATFCYVGPPLPGADTITAFADTDNNTVQDSGEPSGMAEKTWVLPATTPRCEITNGGWIIAENGDRATFGGNAKANASGETQGQEQYQDHGPAQRLTMDSINVLAVVCDGSTRASIFGQATINGLGLVNFRINVQDFGGPGKSGDTYQLLTDGYNSGEQPLGGGNIQIRRK